VPPAGAAWHHAPWDADGVAVFFRDHGLSDLIGFTYGRWDAGAAIADFVGRLGAMADRLGHEDAVVTVALDGENCWETYTGGVRGFVPDLYRAIMGRPGLRLSTMSEALAAVGTGGRQVAPLGTGSWIDGTFRTWLGDPVKNRAWDLLAEARQRVGRPLSSLRAEDPELADLVMRAEASDWFWWFGQGHSSQFDSDFDRLFRHHLVAIYERLGEPVPEALRRPVHATAGGGAGVAVGQAWTPPTARVWPAITGRVDSFFKWVGAGRLLPVEGAMHAASRVAEVRLGVSDDAIYALLVTRGPAARVLEGIREQLCAAGEEEAQATLWPPEHTSEAVDAACGEVLEACVPRAALVAAGADMVRVRLRLESAGGALLEQVPAHRGVPLRLDADALALDHWTA
jgi:hypothetical protein